MGNLTIEGLRRYFAKRGCEVGVRREDEWFVIRATPGQCALAQKLWSPDEQTPVRFEVVEIRQPVLRRIRGWLAKTLSKLEGEIG